MKIGVTTLGADGGKSGISRYVMALIREFAQRKGEFEFEIVAHDDERETFAPRELGLTVLPVPSASKGAAKNLLWHQTELPRLARTRRWDALFLPAGNRRLPWSAPCPTVGTVFDYSLRHVPGKYDAAHQFYITQVLPALAQRLTSVITLSECSKHDIVRYAHVPAERIRVIPAAADERFRPRPPAAPADRPYILYVSRIEHPGKNHVRLIDAFTRLKRERNLPHRLVLAGSDWNGAEAVHQAAAASPAAADIVFTGFVPDATILDLYAGADLVAFPSLWEGFGLPVLEAMQCGVPVACANIASLPEVVGDAALLFDPTDTAQMAATLARALEQPGLRADLARRGLTQARSFSWKRAADETLETLRAAALTRL